MTRSFNTETILIIEDDADVIRLLQILFEREGYDVLIGRNGQEGLAAFQQAQKRIDLVIVDWVMPGMDGGETLAAIRALDQNVKCIVLSGHIWGLKCPFANAILAKPVSMDSLIYTTQHLLNGEKAIPMSNYGLTPIVDN